MTQSLYCNVNPLSSLHTTYTAWFKVKHRISKDSERGQF